MASGSTLYWFQRTPSSSPAIPRAPLLGWNRVVCPCSEPLRYLSLSVVKSTGAWMMSALQLVVVVPLQLGVLEYSGRASRYLEAKGPQNTTTKRCSDQHVVASLDRSEHTGHHARPAGCAREPGSTPSKVNEALPKDDRLLGGGEGSSLSGIAAATAGGGDRGMVDTPSQRAIPENPPALLPDRGPPRGLLVHRVLWAPPSLLERTASVFGGDGAESRGIIGTHLAYCRAVYS